MKNAKKNEESDEQLVASFRSGNNDAFNILFMRYADSIQLSIRKIVGNIEEINDVLQDLSMHLYDKLKNKYQENGKFSGWLHRVVDNYMCSYSRKKKVKIADVDLEAVKDRETEYTLSPMEREKKYADLRKSVKELPREQRILVEMKIWKKMTLEAIAIKLNMKKSTVDKRLQSAYRKIRESMIAKGYDDYFV